MKSKINYIKYVLTICIALLSSNLFSQTLAVKVDWQVRYGGSKTDGLYEVVQTVDGGYIMGGKSNSTNNGNKGAAGHGGYDYWVIKTDAGGGKEWEQSLGGTGDELMHRIVQTYDGGYVIAGNSTSPDTGDVEQPNFDVTNTTGDWWIIKLDANGNTVFSKRYGTKGEDHLYSIKETPDHGFIIGGIIGKPGSGTASDVGVGYGGGTDYWIMKTDSAGNIQWQKVYGGNSRDTFYDIALAANGDYIIAGHSQSGNTSGTNIPPVKTAPNYGGWDIWALRISSEGVVIWQNSFGGNHDDKLYMVNEMPDGNILFAGFSESDPYTANDTGNKSAPLLGEEYDYWVVKTDADGKIIWDKSYGGAGDDEAWALQLTSDGGFVLGGSSDSDEGGDVSQPCQGMSDFWVLKADEYGNRQWDFRFGGESIDDAHIIRQTSDGGYVFGGMSFSGEKGDLETASYGSADFVLVKIICTNPATYYADADHDGFGNPAVTIQACVKPDDFVIDNTDCNDDPSLGGAAIHPGSSEICNSIDDNCDGQMDENGMTVTMTPEGTSTICSGNSVTLTATASSNESVEYQWLRNGSPLNNATNQTYLAQQSGVYQITSTAGECQDTSATTVVSMATASEATISYEGNLDICATGSVLLIANSGPGFEYQWKKGVDTVGTNSQTYVATSPGLYKVRITNNNGCSRTSPGIKVTKSASCRQSGESEKIAALLSVYPNPTSGQFYIDLDLHQETSESAEIQVMNAIGQIVYTEKIPVTGGMLKKEIILGRNLAEGMYLVKVKLGEEAYSSRVVYQK